jgi:hypothetical protein
MCAHKNQKWTPEGWHCNTCGALLESDGDGIKEIVESGQFPQLTPVAEGYFSYSLGRYVSNRHEHTEALKAINDPERKAVVQDPTTGKIHGEVESVNREIPKERQQYLDKCEADGEIPFVTKQYDGD